MEIKNTTAHTYKALMAFAKHQASSPEGKKSHWFFVAVSILNAASLIRYGVYLLMGNRAPLYWMIFAGSVFILICSFIILFAPKIHAKRVAKQGMTVTYGFTEDSNTLTLSFFPKGEYREALRYCGTKSGRDGDKFAATGLTVERTAEGTPYPAEANLVLVCRKLYVDDLKENAFIDPDMLKHYAARDYHRFYICEITEVLVKEA